MLGAEDEEGNSHDIEISVRIDVHAVWTEFNTNSATMTFDATPDCEDGQPIADKITISSTVTNPGGTIFQPGQDSDVTWSLADPAEEEVASKTGIIGDGAPPETWDLVVDEVVEGIWTLNVEVTDGDNVNVENDVTITYPEGSEDSPNPRSE